MSRLIPPVGDRVMCPCGHGFIFLAEYRAWTGRDPIQHAQPAVTRIQDMTPEQLRVSGISPAVAASLRSAS